jgi:hypothetical protein
VGGGFGIVSGKKKFFKFINKLLCIAYLAFPHDKNFPAFFAQLAEISFISVNISLTFYFPELFVCFWYDAAVSAPVHVPETAVDKYNLFVFNKNYVRFTGQIFSMK